ncbi:MAG: SulP family inorganic anion transporter, partial [Myxococcales bacterium]|nr:SulP family inorganic anion transporter [Myxococcales bacterium]
MNAGAARATTPRRRLVADLVAGVSVAMVLIPQSLAYSELAGLPAHRGLLAGALPPILAALFASSPYLQVGPTAMTSLLAFAALSTQAVPGSDAYVGLAALLALIVGLTRLVIGLLRSGAISYLMSQPVLRGFSTAAAILIAASQLPSMLGGAVVEGGVLHRAGATLLSPQAWHWPALGLGVLTMALIVGGRRIHAIFPGVLLAVIVGIAYSSLFAYQGPTVGEVPLEGLPLSLELPWASVPALILPGMVIALVGFAEVAAVCQTFAQQDRQPWDPNREFISQGAANLAAGLVGGFPVGGSFSRSALNRLASAQTRLSGGITGLVVLAFLPFAAILASLPKTVLGAAVILAVLKLLDPRPLLRMWAQSRMQALIGWATFAATLLLAPHLEWAVVGGVALSVALHLMREHRVAILVDVRGRELTLAPMGVLWFGSAPLVREKLAQALADHPAANRVVIDLAGAGRIDLTGATVLADVAESAQDSGLEVVFIGVPPQCERIVSSVVADVATCTKCSTPTSPGMERALGPELQPNGAQAA